MQELYKLKLHIVPVSMARTHSLGMEHAEGRSDIVMFGGCCKFHGYPISLSVNGYFYLFSDQSNSSTHLLGSQYAIHSVCVFDNKANLIR